MTKATQSKKRPVRPAFLIAAGIALLGFGIVSGMALDLATRPAREIPAEPAPRTQPRRFNPPQFLADMRPEQPTGAPARAWADDVARPPASASPMVAFAMPVPAPAREAVVAIVIDDMGVDRARSQRMIEMKGPLTLSLMTYAEGLPDLAARARSAGHEVMAHLPMEPLDARENAGEGVLTVRMEPSEIRRTLAADLDGWSGYVGINNHMGSKFTADRVRMDVVMGELKARGLIWLDSKTTGDSAGTAAAKAANVPFIERDVFLDNVATVEAVLAQLDQLESIAKSRGTAIGIGHPHDATLAALARRLPELQARGVTLVPITEILRRRTGTP